ncbi:MAG: GNAT family N-acetyltransferase [Solirubrobacterales bacterium]|nr:GNAT family N-acetyltransferase [Solirubrobacterales bacterium]
MHVIYSDPDVMRHVGYGPVRGMAESAQMLRAYADHERRHGFSFWAVVERATGAVIGDAGLYTSGAGEIELGYTLARDAWGKGYATEAARACLDVAFGSLGADEVIALADLPNAASHHVLEKLGFVRDGTRRAFGREHALFRLRRA